MKRMLVISALAFALGPLAVGQTKTARRTQTDRVVEQIRKLDQERIQAQIHADAVALDRIYAADFIGIGPSGAVRTKLQVLADFTSHDLNFQSLRPTRFAYASTETWPSRPAERRQLDKIKAKSSRLTIGSPGSG
jgi:hypothetical protein